MLNGNKLVLKAAGCVAAVLVMCCATALAQQAREYTSQDYSAAEKFMNYNVNPLAYKGVVRAQWLEDGRFWFREVDEHETKYVLIDPAKGTRTAAFDQEKLATALNAASKGAVKDEPRHLTISDLSFTDGDRTLQLTISGTSYECKLSADSDRCKRAPLDDADDKGTDHAKKHLRWRFHRTRNSGHLYATGICGFAIWRRGPKRSSLRTA